MKLDLLLLTSLYSCVSYAGTMIENDDYPTKKREYLSISVPLSSQIDTNDMTSHVILQTKKIMIPGHPRAFNPSITRWNGRLLLSFRTYDKKTGSTNPFGLVWLNEDFEPTGEIQLFELPFNNPVLPSKQQDPRLQIIGDRLVLVYNNVLENVVNREIRRMFMVEMDYDGTKFTASAPKCLEHFEGQNPMRYEKNWVPFNYQDQLFLSYSISPHRVLFPHPESNSCETAFVTQNNTQWKWGAPRGGTQAILDGDHYIAFFHSWIDLASVQSRGRVISHYFMGAYTFDAHPPFALRSISPMPIVSKEFYQPPYYCTWKPLRCVFPSGLVADEEFFWVTYGRQDHECWVAKIDKKALLNSLVPVTGE